MGSYENIVVNIFSFSYNHFSKALDLRFIIGLKVLLLMQFYKNLFRSYIVY